METARSPRARHGSAGFTIVETSMMLMVMFILAGALAPIVSESVDTARAIKATNDAKIIASGLIQFQRDLGSSLLVESADGLNLARRASRPQVLMSQGSSPSVDDAPPTDGAGAPGLRKQFLLASPDAAAKQERGNRRAWLERGMGYLEDHLITNRAGYRPKGPSDSNGWNGPYIASLVKSDPWGNRFMINTQWLDGSATAVDQHGNARRAVFVVSAGSNGIIETAFDQPLSDASLGGDDIGVRIQ